MLIMRKMSPFSSTPALITGGSLCASTTFLPLMVTSSRKTCFAGASGLVWGLFMVSSSSGLVARRLEHGRHDAGIAGTAAEVPAEHFYHLGLGRSGVAPEEIGERHQNAGGTEPALQRVIVLERLLQRVELAALVGQRFHRGHRPAFGLHREREAGAHGFAVEQHRAAAADAMLAAHMGAGRAQHMADEVAQQHARLGLARHPAAVEREAQPRALAFVHAAHRIASSTTTGPSRRRRSRRMRADAWISS